MEKNEREKRRESETGKRVQAKIGKRKALGPRMMEGARVYCCPLCRFVNSLHENEFVWTRRQKDAQTNNDELTIDGQTGDGIHFLDSGARSRKKKRMHERG